MPQFKFRGVVEGFYGEPWSHLNRKKAIDYFSDFGFNTYVIAPKNDKNQRLNWKENLDGKSANELKHLIRSGKEQGLSVSQSVSPGLTVTYSSTEDRKAITNRFEQQIEFGADHVFLLWDDIDWDLSKPNDLYEFPDIASAHADFSNEVFSKIGKIALTICPMIYWGRGKSDYLTSLGQKLHPDINLMWTGRQIRSEYLDVVDAKEFESQAKRYPFYWDNFPVNNLNLRHELHTGPLVDRQADLATYSVGLLANPMLQFNASLPSLYTVAEYLKNPTNYHPEKSWEDALTYLYKNDTNRESLRIFYDANTKSQLGGEVSPLLRKCIHELEKARNLGDFEKAKRLALDFSYKIISSYENIQSSDFPYKDLREEIAPWLISFKKHAIVLRELSSQLTDLKSNVENLHKLLEFIDQDRKQVYGDLLWEYLQELIYSYNVS